MAIFLLYNIVSAVSVVNHKLQSISDQSKVNAEDMQLTLELGLSLEDLA